MLPLEGWKASRSNSLDPLISSHSHDIFLILRSAGQFWEQVTRNILRYSRKYGLLNEHKISREVIQKKCLFYLGVLCFLFCPENAGNNYFQDNEKQCSAQMITSRPNTSPNKMFFEINLLTVFMPECRKKGFLSQHAQLALIRANSDIPYWINTFYCPLEPAFQTGQNYMVFTG